VPLPSCLSAALQELGVQILSDLQRQRETILHSRDTLQTVDTHISRSRQILQTMSRRITQNKARADVACAGAGAGRGLGVGMAVAGADMIAESMQCFLSAASRRLCVPWWLHMLPATESACSRQALRLQLGAPGM